VVEGSLDIRWANSTDPTATPRYHLFFLRYANFKSGAQQPTPIVGAAALENCLVKLGFTAEDASNWVRHVHEKNSVSIRNVMMPGERIPEYGLQD
jgi:hypothetical protein